LNNQFYKEEITIEFPNNSLLALLIGQHSINIVKLEKLLNVSINQFGNQFKISGDNKDINLGKTILTNIYNKLSNQEIEELNLNFSYFETELRMFEGKRRLIQTQIKQKKSLNTNLKLGRKLLFQKVWDKIAILKHSINYELVFGLGPAGTGKSYLAVAKGIDMLKKGLVEKIILTRPAVEAGERLGFLPGDMKEKIDPYLRPIYDALYEMMPLDRVEKKNTVWRN
jgi:phosphate starvation-inducible PhoH-like protein